MVIADTSIVQRRCYECNGLGHEARLCIRGVQAFYAVAGLVMGRSEDEELKLKDGMMQFLAQQFRTGSTNLITKITGLPSAVPSRGNFDEWTQKITFYLIDPMVLAANANTSVTILLRGIDPICTDVYSWKTFRQFWPGVRLFFIIRSSKVIHEPSHTKIFTNLHYNLLVGTCRVEIHQEAI